MTKCDKRKGRTVDLVLIMGMQQHQREPVLKTISIKVLNVGHLRNSRSDFFSMYPLFLAP